MRLATSRCWLRTLETFCVNLSVCGMLASFHLLAQDQVQQQGSLAKGTFHEASYVFSHDKDRRTLHFLSGGWSGGRADDSAAARASLFVADVRSLSSCCSRLPGIRAQRLAESGTVRVYVRSLCRNHESLRRSDRVVA